MPVACTGKERQILFFVPDIGTIFLLSSKRCETEYCKRPQAWVHITFWGRQKEGQRKRENFSNSVIFVCFVFIRNGFVVRCDTLRTNTSSQLYTAHPEGIKCDIPLTWEKDKQRGEPGHHGEVPNDGGNERIHVCSRHFSNHKTCQPSVVLDFPAGKSKVSLLLLVLFAPCRALVVSLTLRPKRSQGRKVSTSSETGQNEKKDWSQLINRTRQCSLLVSSMLDLRWSCRSCFCRCFSSICPLGLPQARCRGAWCRLN